VPFYNVEPYIEECIRSLYNQDIPQDEYEVICVDDYSLDGSRAIVEQLRKEYPTLRLICHSENKKLGGARNTGMKAARGKFIWFVDSDDYIYPNVLRTLLDNAEKNEVDILQFDHVRGRERINKEIKLSEITNGEMYLFEEIKSDWFYKIGGAWKQLFSRDFLKKTHLQYIEGAMFEDTDYLLHAFLLADNVQHISIDAYFYRINNDSITMKSISPEKLAWRVNLLARCAQLVNLAKSQIAQDTIKVMVSNSLSQLRKVVKNFSFVQKREYTSHLIVDIKKSRPFMSCRTWLALRYGITWFV
jgi:glycosyltransferase involved in cell wall biosynthesis